MLTLASPAVHARTLGCRNKCAVAVEVKGNVRMSAFGSTAWHTTRLVISQARPHSSDFPGSGSGAAATPPPAAQPPAPDKAAVAKQPKVKEESDTLHLTQGSRSHLYGINTLRKYFPKACAELVANGGKGSCSVHIYMRRPDGRLSTYEVKISTNSTRNSFILRMAGLSRFLQDTGMQDGDLVRLSWAPQPETAAGPAGGGMPQQRKVMVEVLGRSSPPPAAAS
ncbi:hypothetical protein CHLRE_03g207937v5 [Chlamydomonas reinhardtii]|uniref:Uncharacterized protein n=1 Tax=Chlamydomonas reinhardtii TaxID=3055 RepID=A0A2K3DZS5_CHLRE|nr:uncharacterized protein CHLRE_03g207937v5 [Chlamydomonas reinhardtii]PNW86042.1 hypothetical protein CHLRE_03g207937v5 [Chlamydomonas reinhardtii]